MGIPIEVSFKKMLGHSNKQADIAGIINYFRGIYPTICDRSSYAFDGILALLKKLKDEGFYLAIVTSKKHSVLTRNLINLKMDGFFDAIIGSDNVSNYKPHPEPLFKAIAKIGVKSEEKIKPVMVGDAASDIEMGKAAC